MVTNQLLIEYGLTPYKCDALRLCQFPVFWKQGGLTHSITVLYELIERGLLTGPKRGKPHGVPFELTGKGRDILARIDSGLHTPGWLSPSRVRALKWLSSNDGRGIDMLRPRGISMITMRALRKAGYISTADEATWRITDLGREAWAEWRHAGREHGDGMAVAGA